MAQDYQYAGWWSRPAAILYVSTVGLVVGVVVTVLGTLFGVIGTVLRLAGKGDHQTYRPISGPLANTISWWTALIHYAATGRGEFKLFPDFMGDMV